MKTYQNLLRLDGKVSVVTGASGGIGLAIARILAEYGSKIVMLDINEAKLKEVAEEMKGEGYEVMFIPLNVTERKELDKSVKTIKEVWGRIDILVNAAGIHEIKSIDSLTVGEFRRTIEVNLLGVYHCTQAILPIMKNQNYGAIVSIASLAGVRGHPTGGSHYAASKGAIISFMRSIAREVGKNGIRANCIAPGMVRTQMAEDYTENERKAYVQNVPLGRIGEPDDIAHGVHYLVSEASSYITGQKLNICGGSLMA